jgi:ribulose-bisphosphate carboxylase large chain
MFRPDDTAMPVVSSGQWGGQAPETYRQAGTLDVMYLAGGGILAHPLGPAAGLRALQQAWEAAVEGIPLADYAGSHEELRATLAKFGKLRS